MFPTRENVFSRSVLTILDLVTERSSAVMSLTGYLDENGIFIAEVIGNGTASLRCTTALVKNNV